MPRATSTDLEQLVANFAANESAYCGAGSTYNESEARSDFINPLFEALGWDVTNRRGLARPLREVILEANVRVNEATKKPDYEFRHNGYRKFFVEAKKPSVDISSDPAPALQLRRYGWSAGLAVSVLTNFRQFYVYDCTVQPLEGDNPRVALLATFDYHEFVSKFDELKGLVSHELVTSGDFDSKFAELISKARGDQAFDKFFLDQTEKWRLLLANDIHKHDSSLPAHEVDRLTQLFLNRIVFLRICEDRNLEEYETLKNIPAAEAVPRLMDLFKHADSKYDSGLFELLKGKLTPSVLLSNEVIMAIVGDLYYPKSPYSFSVVSPAILGSIYERFIARAITIENGKAQAVEKPEVRESNGVFPTPEYIVRTIVEDTFALKGDVLEAKVLDPAAGSGVFITEAFDKLLQAHLDNYVKAGEEAKLRHDDNGDWYLSLDTKKNILISQIFGVDIDHQAVEVAKFSLYLKLLEDVPSGEIAAVMARGENALPHLENNIKPGNSLIDSRSYFQFHDIGQIQPGELDKISPFDWGEQFQPVMDSGGFDVVVANPPYIRIQNIVHYSPLEAEFYTSDASPYVSSHGGNFDKYQLFVERGYQLLNGEGILAYIVPHKFATNAAGRPLRRLISKANALAEFVHFGSLQLFPGQATTYTCLLFISRKQRESFQFERVDSLQEWQSGDRSSETLSSDSISEEPWTFLSHDDKELFNKIEGENPGRLGTSAAKIFVPLQTSADNIYIVTPLRAENGKLMFRDKDGREWTVEESITRPAILDIDDFDSLRGLAPNKIMIFPYAMEGGQNRPIPEAVMKSRFPLAYKYLLAFKAKLSSRSMQGSGPWYRFGRSQNLNLFSAGTSGKLIIKNPALRATVALDTADIHFTGGGNGPYYGVLPNEGVPIYFVHALLNSELFDRWVKARSSVFRGGYYSYGKQFIENFPVIDLVKNSAQVNEIALAWKGVLDSPPADPERRKQLLLRVNEKINSLYGIATEGEMNGSSS